MRNYLDSIDSAFRKTSGQYPDKIALICREKQLTFSELDQMVDVLAKALSYKGVNKQDKVIIYLPHMPEWITAWFALQRIGAVVVPVAHYTVLDDLNYIANDCKVETIFCSRTNIDRLSKVIPNSTIKRVIICDSENNIIPEMNSENLTVEVFTLRSLVSGNLPPLPQINIEEKETAEIFYTSGTTGQPKGVPISHNLMLELFDDSKKQSDALIPRGKGVALQGSPLTHILGQDKGLGSLFSGETLILLPHCNIDALIQNIEKYEVSILLGTPTMCRMILDNERLEQYNLQSLRYVFVSGEEIPPEVNRKWQEKFGKPLFTGYGCTEACGSISAIVAGGLFPEGTTGKIVSIKKVMLVKPDTLEPIKDAHVGELLVSSDNMVESYLNSPEETAKRFINLEGRLWFRTGDIIEINEDGWVFFKERSVNVIKHKGYRVGPSKIEGVLNKHHAVSSCCVVGLPDQKAGEKIMACVVLKSDMENAAGYELVSELVSWCRERLMSYEVPHFIEFRSELPLNPTGKILRRKLKEEIIAEKDGLYKS